MRDLAQEVCGRDEMEESVRKGRVGQDSCKQTRMSRRKSFEVTPVFLQAWLFSLSEMKANQGQRDGPQVSLQFA